MITRNIRWFRFVIPSLFTVLLGSGCGNEIKLRNLPPQNNKVCCFGDSLVFGTGAASAFEYSNSNFPARSLKLDLDLRKSWKYITAIK